ncbi:MULTISPECIES: hypothetical protein [Citromicrobium]|uniref:hypothetical protein n=1 Tax=Citromicrobium TaxID=72173 RepID=UPI0012E2F19F|nr:MULTISPECIES: hypothetical protein [Citromicrobium]
MRWWPHLATVVVVTAAAAALELFVPQVADSESEWFAYIAGWATLFGLSVALIEVHRVTTKAQAVAKGQRTVSDKVQQERKNRDLTECRLAIESALELFDQQKPASSRDLSRIIYLYSYSFPDEYKDDKSLVHGHCLVIRGYLASSATPSYRDTAAIRGAMTDMTANIGRELSSLKYGEII